LNDSSPFTNALSKTESLNVKSQNERSISNTRPITPYRIQKENERPSTSIFEDTVYLKRDFSNNNKVVAEPAKLRGRKAPPSYM
jgi:hypothetical protein